MIYTRWWRRRKAAEEEGDDAQTASSPPYITLGTPVRLVQVKERLRAGAWAGQSHKYSERESTQGNTKGE